MAQTLGTSHGEHGLVLVAPQGRMVPSVKKSPELVVLCHELVVGLLSHLPLIMLISPSACGAEPRDPQWEEGRFYAPVSL